MLLGTIYSMPGVRYRLSIGLWTNFIVFNYQVVKWVLIFADPVFKNQESIQTVVTQQLHMLQGESHVSRIISVVMSAIVYVGRIYYASLAFA